MSADRISFLIPAPFLRGGSRSRRVRQLGGVAFLLAALLATSCRQQAVVRQADSPPRPEGIDPMTLVLTPQTGAGKTDQEIARRQQEVRDGKSTELALERLGWAFVAKARETFDAGFYKLAEQCALALEQHQPQHHGAGLLRGHALHNLHRFKEAELLANQLVAQRGSPLDFGLLGDVLLDQGRLAEAIAAYQSMADLKPDAQAHVRIAQVRWLKGDVEGAIEAMQVAAGAAGSRAGEMSAWVLARLAGFQWQAGALGEARESCAAALAAQPDYAPALLLRGRMWLAEGKSSEAAEILARAAALNPLPEHQWAWADALREAGRSGEAQAVEEKLRRQGAMEDPRSFALFLATRGESLETALRLAKSELEFRRDVLTHDAVAWALTGAGKHAEAQSEMERALAEGTEDARLFFHAAVIAARNGRLTEARQWSEKTSRLAHLLLPSERQQFQAAASDLAQRAAGPAQAATASLSTRVN